METMKHLNSTAPSGWSVKKVSLRHQHPFIHGVRQEWDSISMKDRRIQLDIIVLQPFMRCSGCNKLGKDKLLCGVHVQVIYML